MSDVKNETVIANQSEQKEAEKIAEISKKGYQLLKEDRIEDAIAAFKSILQIEDNNNYALVGLGDCERKQNHFKNAVNFNFSRFSIQKSIFSDSSIHSCG